MKPRSQTEQQFGFSAQRLSNAALFALMSYILMSSSPGLFAHEDQNTHPALTIGAFLFLDQAAPEDAVYFLSSDRSLVRSGSIDEDACPNYASHFYDPKTKENKSPIPPNSGITPGGCIHPDGFVKQLAPVRAAGFWADAVADYRAAGFPRR